MKKIVKKHYRFIIGLIIGIIIPPTIACASQSILTGSDVSYNTGTSHGSKNNIQGAIDELYEKANSCSKSNKNIVSAYTYSESGNNKCITGDESTCQKTECYKNKEKNSCKTGDIITYKVNDDTTVRFHVMFDEGDYITMQSQRATIYEVKWSTESEGPYGWGSAGTWGPIEALPKLEEATKNWTNVENQTYEMGTTVFKINNYTSCTSAFGYDTEIECTKNTYTMDIRTAKARMITLQEAKELGCKNINKLYVECPIWMHNYLNGSTSGKGTENDEKSSGSYWTMNNFTNGQPYLIDVINILEILYRSLSEKSDARAVIQISK